MKIGYKTVYLVRHGENELNRNDPKLTFKGEVQANAIKFGFSQIDGVVASPSRRTVETAKIISKNLSIPYQVSKLVKERIDYTDVPGMGYSNFKKLCHLSSNNRNYPLPNGESSYTSGLRLEYFVTYASNIIKKAIVIVTHQGIISDYLRNKFSSDLINEKSPLFPQIREDVIVNGSITKISVLGNEHILEYVGKKDHLHE